MDDRRKHPRREVRLAAFIQAPTDLVARPCRVLNISPAGALIECDALSADEFTLSFAAPGAVTRYCQVRWRRRTYAGVQFVEPPRLPPSAILLD